ncbi:hypothetical protein PInf_004416 [Phytophthora infestans]|nr:hypothetical protein PInf_004416 [Phytophthora infestans]
MSDVETGNGGNQADKSLAVTTELCKTATVCSAAVRVHECDLDDKEFGGTSPTAADGAKVRNVAKARRRTKQVRIQAVKRRAIAAAATSDKIDEALASLDAKRRSRRRQHAAKPALN